MSDTTEYIKFYGHDSEPSGVDATSGTYFEAKANPENIKTYRSILFNADNRANTGVDVMQFKGYGPQYFDVKLRIEKWDELANRGGNSSTPVKDQIEKLLKAVYDFRSASHKSPYVTIHWGQHFKFIGHLENMSIEYLVFQPNGECTCAEVELKFVNHVNLKTNVFAQNRNSPDMSHLKTIKEGDKIPLICDEIYEDPTYYIQIAELNGLTNFRNVSTGKQIIFPPLVNDI